MGGRPDHQAHDHHDHDHDHGYRQRGEQSDEKGRRRLKFVLILTTLFTAAEVAGGIISNSLALIADAGHMLSDVAALALALFAIWLARRPGPPEKTYGYLRIEILAALANGVALVLIAAAILWQAYHRFFEPEPIEGELMLGVAVAGLAVNIAAALLLHSSSGHSLNLRGAYLHVLGDLLGSIGAIVAAIIILATGWLPADPLISVFVALLILGGSWRLIRESADVLLEAVPRGIDLDRLRASIERVPGVRGVSDLHVWTLTSGYIAMSGHAAIDDPAHHRNVLDGIHRRMHEDFGITHVTIQLDHPSFYSIDQPRR